MKLVENVYEAVCGEYVDEANRRICERLGVDEDSDVELIIDSMFDITHIVAEKMFSYGQCLRMYNL